MASEEEDTKKRKRGGMLVPLVAGLVLALAGGGGGFWAVTSGPFAPPPPEVPAGEEMVDAEAPRLPPTDAVFVELEPVVISLGGISGRHLLFSAHLEVPAIHQEEVTRLLPRVLDVLNSYLRVVSLDELGEPESLALIRAQILRRIQVVTGAGRVSDLLVTQFVVN
jgi:flagellar protein FliL